MRKVALAIKAAHPNIAFISAAKSEVIEIAAARTASDGIHTETFDAFITPKLVKFDESEKIDPGVDVERARAEHMPLEEAISKLDEWLGGKPRNIILYLFSKNEYVALTTLEASRNSKCISNLLEKYNCTLVQDEMVYQFNVALNRHCTPVTVAKSFNMPLPNQGKPLTAAEAAENSLWLANLMPLRGMFDAFEVNLPKMLRYRDWAHLNNFVKDDLMDLKVSPEGRACRVIFQTKCVYAGSQRTIARVTAIKRVDGNLLPLEIFDRLIVPTRFSMDIVDALDEGLSKEEIEEKGVLFETAFNELSKWVEDNRSACVYAWDERTLNDIQEDDTAFGTSFYTRIFGSTEQELSCISNLFIGCFSDGRITPRRVFDLLGLDAPDIVASADAHEATGEIRMLMAILLASLNRRNSAEKAKRKAAKEAEQRRKELEAADAARDPMDVNVAFYTKKLMDRQNHTQVDVGSPEKYLSSAKTRTFRCPECGREMLLDYWYLDREFDRNVPFGAVFGAIGVVGCKDHGKFICSAQVRRDSNTGVIIGTTSFLEYNSENFLKYERAQEQWKQNQAAKAKANARG